MNHYLIAFHSFERNSKRDKLQDVLSTDYDLWASEYDEGLFFISSVLSSEEISEQLEEDVQRGVTETLFVFQLSGTWAGSGTINTCEALRERLIDS